MAKAKTKDQLLGEVATLEKRVTELEGLLEKQLGESVTAISEVRDAYETKLNMVCYYLGVLTRGVDPVYDLAIRAIKGFIQNRSLEDFLDGL